MQVQQDHEHQALTYTYKIVDDDMAQEIHGYGNVTLWQAVVTAGASGRREKEHEQDFSSDRESVFPLCLSTGTPGIEVARTAGFPADLLDHAERISGHLLTHRSGLGLMRTQRLACHKKTELLLVPIVSTR